MPFLLCIVGLNVRQHRSGAYSEMTARKEDRKQRSYLKWDSKMDSVMISTLMGQMQSNQKVGMGWTIAAYTKVSLNLEKQIGLDVSSEQCKTRWKTLRSNHVDAKKIVESDGFWWDEEAQMLSAEDSAWRELIEKYPAVKNYRDKVLPYYKELDILVGTDSITGFDEVNNHYEEDAIDLYENGVESPNASVDEEAPVGGGFSPNSVSSASPIKRIKVRRSGFKKYKTIIEKLDKLVNKLADNAGQSQPRPDLILLEKNLKEIPNLTKDEILRALFYYRDNDAAARGFLSVSHDLKRSYLRREFNNMTRD